MVRGALQFPQHLHVWFEQLFIIILTMLKWLMETKEFFLAVLVNAKSKAVIWNTVEPSLSGHQLQVRIWEKCWPISWTLLAGRGRGGGNSDRKWSKFACKNGVWGVEYSVQGFAGYEPNSLLVNNAPALNSLIGFMNFATDTVKWHI